MANAFDTDENCVCAFLFEPGAFQDDDVDGGALDYDNAYGIADQETSIVWSGSASMHAARYANDPFYVSTEPSGFPLKSGTGQTTFSITFAYYHTGSDESTFVLLRKSSSFLLTFEYYPSDEPAQIDLAVGCYNGGWEAEYTGIQLAKDQWYHIGLTFDGATGACNVRVYDAVAESVETWNHTFTKIPADNSSDFYIGDYYSEDTYYMDEVAFFKDVLTADEIDQIRAGTYGSGGGPGEQTTESGGDFHTLLMGCPF